VLFGDADVEDAAGLGLGESGESCRVQHGRLGGHDVGSLGADLHQLDPNIFVQEVEEAACDLPVTGSKAPGPWKQSSAWFSAGEWPLPFFVTQCTITGRPKERAALRVSSRACT
jgi:hypothetical protein